MEHVRPNRSDDHVSTEAAAELEAAARQYFDEAAPKRHTKPQRSEYSSSYADALADGDDGAIPEYAQFQQLEKDDTQTLIFKGSSAAEEFSETEYYADLNGVNREHHTTGTGFISTENKNGEGFSLDSDTSSECHAASSGNPATNDWIPAATTKVVDLVTGKPSRS
ncbi:hypothetical protein M569_03189, partial [Genlisea aurea]